MGSRRPLLVLVHCLELFSCVLLSKASLYNSTDELVILDSSNFTREVLGSENAWFVEFYNSWCGHCIQFAPIWKLFGKDVRNWQHSVKVGVLDCAVDENIGVCREYEIMGYPTMRLFGAYTKKGDLGKNTKSRTIEELGNSVIDFLVEQQHAKNGSSSWINLQPCQSTLQDIWKDVPQSVKNVVVILDGPNSHTARGVIMDLGGYPGIIVRYKEATSDDVKQYGAASLPVIMHFNHSGSKEIIKNSASTNRHEITELLLKKYHLKRSMLPYKSMNRGIKHEDSPKKEFEGGGDGRPEEINSDKLNYDDDLPDTAYSAEKKDHVFMVDIENAVRYALSHEVVQHKIISGQALSSLQEFLNVIVKYLPTRPAVHKFLSLLHEYTLSQSEGILGEAFASKIKHLQAHDSVLPDEKPWIGCRGSTPKYRGYPCGLWTTFHTLTVNAVLQDGHNEHFNPKQVLRAIHGYVRDFFSCKYCSKHFQEMYKMDRAESSVNIADDSILWLWRAHNKVNKRLAGDESEDPKTPKQQFPPPSSCPSCWNRDSFNEKEVLLYLKNIYSRGALSFKGTQTIVAKIKNRQAKVKEALDRHREGKTFAKFGDEHQSLQNMTSTWSFNTTDISLCVFLYGLSTIIIMCVYCIVVIRRKMRRKKFIQMYKEPPASKKIYFQGKFQDSQPTNKNQNSEEII